MVEVEDRIFYIYGWVASKYTKIERDLEMLKDRLGEGDEAYQFLNELNICVHELGESVDDLATLINRNDFYIPGNTVEIRRTHNALDNLKRIDKGNRFWRIMDGRSSP